MYIEKIGDKFGFIIFDECHHLPAEQYQYIARSSIAPFRLGLSATVERPDGKEEIIYELLGDKVYEGQISDMVSNVLAPYDVICVQVPLSEEDQLRYKEARAVYTGFIKKNRIMMSGPGGWQSSLENLHHYQVAGCYELTGSKSKYLCHQKKNLKSFGKSCVSIGTNELLFSQMTMH